MNIKKSSSTPATVVHTRNQIRWLLAISLLVLLTVGSYDKSNAQIVSKPVTPDTLDIDLRQLPIIKIWQPGDSVWVIPQGFDPDSGYDRSTPRLDYGRIQESGFQKRSDTTAVTPKALDRDLSKQKPIKPWKPGDPIRVIPEGEVGPEYRGNESHESELEGSTPFESVHEVSTPVLTTNFQGIPATGFLPPDVVGDVGPNHYIQMVNTAFAIYDKNGALLAGPSLINSLWSGFGGPCETGNKGDPIVQYDHLADRWLVSQFAFDVDTFGNPIPPFIECIAISRTPDPVAGGWFLYGFAMPEFPDYPKISVWPDAYYMSTFEVANLGVFAFDRANMLNGNPAIFIGFTIPSLSSGRSRTRILPSDLDGATPPPFGAPNIFVRSVDGAVQGGGADRLEIFEFHADFATPANSTFTGPTVLPTAPYDILMCGNTMPRDCIPQPGTTEGLDPLSNRLMRRLQYRNFGTYETLVANQTIDVNGNDLAGIRWYELRKVAGVWSIYQQGTYSPDNIHRWMGSIAMDRDGNIALGYSVSSNSVFPGIRYTSRLATDPPGTMGSEVILASGGGSQTHTRNRWGDYSSMNIDPQDDCTFWYTTEYYDATSTAGWKTLISSFKKPSCGEEPYGFMYSAKLVCGKQMDANNLVLARGIYATAINIHNPNNFDVTFSKKLALTFPPGEQKPGKVMPISKDILGPDEAIEVDCMDIQKRLFPNGFPAPYIKGFVVIQSTASLDVTAVYTCAKPKGFLFWSSYEVASIDVEHISERKLVELPPQELDHFKIYEVDHGSLDAPVGVLLTGQFDDNAKAGSLIALTHFANPTRKVHPAFQTEIKDTNKHFNLYTLTQSSPEPIRTIRFHNQFGQHSVDIGIPTCLLVPAQKTSNVGSVFPNSLDHYKCYKVININTMPTLPSVTLKDQFGSEENVQVLDPSLFCVPVSKSLPGLPPQDGIVNDEDHLVIYDIPPTPHEREIMVRDQFGERSLKVIRSVMLAVPTKKQVVVPHDD